MVGILYFLSLLSKILTLATVIVVLSSILLVVFMVVHFICKSLAAEGTYTDFNGKWAEWAQTVVRKCIPFVICSTLLLVFCPTTKEAYVIYGVGETINYLKSNDTAKQLPDKALNALDSWIDYITIETDEETEQVVESVREISNFNNN